MREKSRTDKDSYPITKTDTETEDDPRLSLSYPVRLSANVYLHTDSLPHSIYVAIELTLQLRRFCDDAERDRQTDV